jgi:hypothetical protein
MKDNTTNPPTYTVTLQLKEPIVNLKIINGQRNPYYDPNIDPNNDDKEDWFGKASYFSIMISPETKTQHKENAVWVKGDMALNKNKARCDWKKLMDFRDPVLAAAMNLGEKAKALYEDIVEIDPQIK